MSDEQGLAYVSQDGKRIRSTRMQHRITLCGLLMLLVSGCTATAKQATLADGLAVVERGDTRAATAKQATLADGLAAVKRGDTRAALEIYKSIADRHPDTMEGAQAIDAAIELSGQRLFPQSSYACSPEAVAKYTDAERHFGARAIDAALGSYLQAVERCPENANWSIHAGDAYFSMGEYKRAKALYLRGLQLDPWNRQGHRFLADAEFRLGDATQAYQNAVLAVVSDPTYEAGWQFLKQVTRTLGGQWNRRVEPKPRIEKQNGKPTIVVSPFYESNESLAVWLVYGVVRRQFTEGRPAERNTEGKEPLARRLSPEEWSRMSPLERERFLVFQSLDVYTKVTSKNPSTTAVFWETFKKAVQEGFMDEAIYVHLMDRDLAPSYGPYRTEHTSRLMEYITKIIAPVPPPGNRRA